MNPTQQTNGPLSQTDYYRMLLQGDCIRRTYGPTAHRLYTEHVLDPSISRSTFSTSKKDWWNDSDALLDHLQSLEISAFNGRNDFGSDNGAFPKPTDDPDENNYASAVDFDDMDEEERWIREAKFT